MALSTHAKEMWPAQAMRHSPYTIPPRLSAMHHRSPYNSCFHPPPSANVSPSAFFQTSMLSSATGCNFTGATAYPPTPLSNGYTSQVNRLQACNFDSQWGLHCTVPKVYDVIFFIPLHLTALNVDFFHLHFCSCSFALVCLITVPLWECGIHL